MFVCPLPRGCLFRVVAAGGSVGNSRQRRVFGPVGTGPRLELRSQRWDQGSFPLHRLFASKRATPERGQMLRRADVRPLASVVQSRPASPDRGHGRVAASPVSPYASRRGRGVCSRSSPSSLDQLFGLLARCSLPLVADESRRLSAPRGSPGPWLGIVRLERTMPAGSLCDAGLMRRAPGTRPPTLRHGPSRPCTGLPI